MAFRTRFRHKDDKTYDTAEDLYQQEWTEIRNRKSKPNWEEAGGFFAEDDEEGGPSERKKPRAPDELPDFTDPAWNIDVGEVKLSATGHPICIQCTKEFPASFYYDQFGHPLCDGCKSEATEERRLITRTEAKELFLLKDAHLDQHEPKLRFISRKNPHNPHWGDMKLYLRTQVKLKEVWKRAMEVWGSGEELAAAKEKRVKQASQRKEKQFENKLKALRKQVRGEARLRKTADTAHTHNFGPETYDEKKDVYSKACTSCPFVDAYEKM